MNEFKNCRSNECGNGDWGRARDKNRNDPRNSHLKLFFFLRLRRGTKTWQNKSLWLRATSIKHILFVFLVKTKYSIQELNTNQLNLENRTWKRIQKPKNKLNNKTFETFFFFWKGWLYLTFFVECSDFECWITIEFFSSKRFRLIIESFWHLKTALDQNMRIKINLIHLVFGCRLPVIGILRRFSLISKSIEVHLGSWFVRAWLNCAR